MSYVVFLLAATNVIICSLFVAMWYFGALSLPVAMLIAAAFVVPISYLGYRISVRDFSVQKEATEIIAQVIYEARKELKGIDQKLDPVKRQAQVERITRNMTNKMRLAWHALSAENKIRFHDMVDDYTTKKYNERNDRKSLSRRRS